MTDGTAADTRELSVAGASSGGLFNTALDPDFTAFGGKALFLGSDASDRSDLWVTDGTSVGTREIEAVGAYWQGLIPQNFAVVGNRALFNGLDANFAAQLWVTDGTSAGTEKLPGQRGFSRRAQPFGYRRPSRLHARRCRICPLRNRWLTFNKINQKIYQVSVVTGTRRIFRMICGDSLKGRRRALGIAAACLIGANIGVAPTAKGDEAVALPAVGQAGRKAGASRGIRGI